MENNIDLKTLSDEQLNNLFNQVNSRLNMTQNEYKPRNAGVYKIAPFWKVPLEHKIARVKRSFDNVKEFFLGFLYFCLTVCMAGFFGILFCLIVNKFFSWLVH